MIKSISVYKKKFWLQPLLFCVLGFLPLSIYNLCAIEGNASFLFYFSCMWLPMAFLVTGFMRSLRVGTIDLLFLMMAALLTLIRYPPNPVLNIESQLPGEFLIPFSIAVFLAIVASGCMKKH